MLSYNHAVTLNSSDLLLIRVSGLPNEREAVYGALDKWTAWETEFPLIAASKALRMLRMRRRWIRVIQERSTELHGLELVLKLFLS
ncbi:hypothetical protein Vadar_004840 [Vaccinium darrowii]|uniref:Uncharacterized protein n=1 Tax=Vaccinium darrowii TaxID=229202 RepID=A0ACB7ZAG5_9ERIC|nr:hypothetical protein Vadar_004840 [Vaccinium darrowii]